MKLPRVLPPGSSSDDAQGGFDGNVVLLYVPSNCPCPCDLSIVLLLLCNYYKYSESVALYPGRYCLLHCWEFHALDAPSPPTRDANGEFPVGE